MVDGSELIGQGSDGRIMDMDILDGIIILFVCVACISCLVGCEYRYSRTTTCHTVRYTTFFFCPDLQHCDCLMVVVGITFWAHAGSCPQTLWTGDVCWVCCSMPCLVTTTTTTAPTLLPDDIATLPVGMFSHHARTTTCRLYPSCASTGLCKHNYIVLYLFVVP